MPLLRVHSLGCKLNRLEADAIALAFQGSGYALAGDPGTEADLVIINTCTVTSMAEQKARRAIRQALRENPRALVVVTGCYAQVEAEPLAALGGERLLIVKGENKAELLDVAAVFAEGRLAASRTAPGAGVTADPFSFDTGMRGSRSRPALKIQDGCDHHCAYCRVSIARGPSRSLDAETVLERLRKLEAAGAAEAVLVGVNISLFRDGDADLAALLERLVGGTRSIALRLSSLEPGPALFRERFFAALEHPRIRPHFHISLQSLSAPVLERMGRRYSPEEALDFIARLRRAKGDPFIACDLIAGFPGETAEQADETLARAEGADFAWIHAFPFSRRPGTAAWSLKPRVPERDAALRVEALTSLARRGRRAYAARQEGRVVEAILQRGAPLAVSGGTWLPAVTENSLKVMIPATGRPGTALSCRLAPLPPDFPAEARAEALGLPLNAPTGGASDAFS